MKLIIEIHAHGRQQRAYGPSVKEATIEIQDMGLPEGREVEERWFRDYFQRVLGEVPEDPDDWFVYQWKSVERVAPNTWRLRAERPYDD